MQNHANCVRSSPSPPYLLFPWCGLVCVPRILAPFRLYPFQPSSFILNTFYLFLTATVVRHSTQLILSQTPAPLPVALFFPFFLFSFFTFFPSPPFTVRTIYLHMCIYLCMYGCMQCVCDSLLTTPFCHVHLFSPLHLLVIVVRVTRSYIYIYSIPKRQKMFQRLHAGPGASAVIPRLLLYIPYSVQHHGGRLHLFLYLLLLLLLLFIFFF